MLVELSVVQEVKRAGDKEADETEDEEGKPRHFKKNIDESLREWIETQGCRCLATDAYFDNPPGQSGEYARVHLVLPPSHTLNHSHPSRSLL